MSEHIVRRGARYYYRRRVPVELIDRLDGKTEIQRALGTSDPKEARKLARRMAVEVDELFERVKVGAVLEGPKVVPARVSGAWSDTPEDEHGDPDDNELRDDVLAVREAASRAWLREELAAIRENIQSGSTAGQRTLTDTGAPTNQQRAQPSLADAFTAWVRIRQPTQATQDTMQRVIQRFRETRAPVVLSAILRPHITALVGTLHESSISTQRTYLSMFKALLSAAVSAELIESNIASNVHIEGKQKGKPRIPFNVSDVQGIVSKLPTSGAGRWIPLIALFTGARLNEIGQLRREDIKQETYRDGNGKARKVPVLYITDEGDDQRIKNESSRRRVPVHKELIRLGFMDYASKQTGPIFPELKPDKNGRVTADFGRAFSKALRTTYGVTDTRKTFHSLRHLFKDVLREHGVHKSVNDALTGHSSGDTADEYGGDYPLRPLVEAIDKFEIHGLDIK